MKPLPNVPALRVALLGAGVALALLVPGGSADVTGNTQLGELYGTEAGLTGAPGLVGPAVPISPGSLGTSQSLHIHTVVSGDTLSQLAARFCGDWSKWREIYAANRDQVQDPDLIYPGQQLRISCTQGGAFATQDGGAWSGTEAGGEILSQAGAQVGSSMDAITHMPLPRGSFRVSSHFNPARTLNGVTRPHQGIDLAAPSGTPVGAAGGGVVISAGSAGGYGNRVEIRHPDGTITSYAHMKNGSLSVSPGDTVFPGQQIGQVGSTGHSTGPHLHFETRNAQRVARNPAPALGLA